MARKTQQNDLTSPELLAQCNPDNMRLSADFLNYLKSVQRSQTTIASYKNDLEIVMVWLLKNAGNKFFVDITKRDLIAFQNDLLYKHNNSPARVRRLKSAISSLSNFIETILDDEYPNFRNIVNKIENPANEPTREKTVLSEQQCQDLLDKLCERGQYEKACLAALAIYSGRRKSELVRFKVSYFDDENLVFGGSLYKTPKKVKTKGKGNGKFLNLYTLAKPFKPYLDLWLNQRKEMGIESEWLFPLKSDPTQPMKADTLNSWAETFSRILGVDLYLHALRHRFTTALVEAGLPDDVIQVVVGWSSTQMVRIYDDSPVENKLETYFGEDGIKTVQQTSLQDL